MKHKLLIFLFLVISYAQAEYNVTEEEFTKNYEKGLSGAQYIKKLGKPFVVFTHKDALVNILKNEIKKRNGNLVSEWGSAYEFASDSLKRDPDIIMLALRYYSKAFHYFGSDLKSNREIALKCVKKNGFVIAQLDERFQKDKEFAIESIKQNEFVIENTLLKKFRENEEMGLLALNESKVTEGYIYQSFSDVLKNNKKIILKACETAGIYEYIPPLLKNDKDILFQCIKNYDWDMEQIDNSLKDDKNFMLRFINYDGKFFYYASERLKADKDVAMEAFKKSFRNYMYFSEKLRTDRNITINAVKNSGLLLKYASASLRDDEFMVKLAVASHPKSFLYASKRLKNDKGFALKLMETAPLVFCSMPEYFRHEELLSQHAISLDPLNLACANPIFHKNREMVLNAAQKNGFILKYLTVDYFDDKEIVLKALKSTVRLPQIIRFISERLRNDYDIALVIITRDPTKIYLISRMLRHNKKFMTEAVKINPAIYNVENELYQDFKF